MKAVATAVAVVVLLVASSGCSSDTDKPEAKSMPTKSSTPGPKATKPATPPGKQYNVDCIAVAANMGQRIASGEEKGVGMVAGRAVAVTSPDFENVYFVAMQFKASGVSETQLGVWAISSRSSWASRG